MGRLGLPLFGAVGPGASAGPEARPSADSQHTGDGRQVADEGGILGATAGDGGAIAAAEDRSHDLLLLLATLTALLLGAALGTGRLVAARWATGDGKPVLFMDVDGVITLDEPTEETWPRPYVLLGGYQFIGRETGARLRRLAERFELVWATGWQKRANDDLPLILGLPGELPALVFGRRARYGSSDWKVRRIERYARERPAAWVDDNIEAAQEDWARDRRAPTLLIKTDAAEGLEDRHVDRLLAWADALAAQERASARARQAARGSQPAPTGRRTG
jgi:HAD domain in Swiss Army Knife RNA repair proteins